METLTGTVVECSKKWVIVKPDNDAKALRAKNTFENIRPGSRAKMKLDQDGWTITELENNE